MKNRRILPLTFFSIKKQKRILLSLLLFFFVVPLVSCGFLETVSNIRRYRVLFTQNSMNFHVMPVTVKHQELKEELFFKDSIVHAGHLYTLGVCSGGIKRYPLQHSNPMLYADFPPWLNALPSHERAQSISLDKDALVMLITGQPKENASAYQAIQAIDILTQSPVETYAVDAGAILHQIEIVELDQKTFLLATSNHSPCTFFVAPYPPPGNTVTFRSMVTMKENIVSWDYEEQIIVVHLQDQSTQLLNISLDGDEKFEIERYKSIPPHPLYQFDNPQVSYSSKKKDILLWEPQMDGSSWIFNTLDSRHWYPLNLPIHCTVSVETNNHSFDVKKTKDTSFYSLVRSNDQFEFHFLGTRFIENTTVEDWSIDDSSN
jgi:hypothetical protein